MLVAGVASDPCRITAPPSTDVVGTTSGGHGLPGVSGLSPSSPARHRPERQCRHVGHAGLHLRSAVSSATAGTLLHAHRHHEDHDLLVVAPRALHRTHLRVHLHRTIWPAHP